MIWQGFFTRGSTLATAALTTLFLSACGDQLSGFNVRETVGLTKSTPDEFVVVSSQPLSVPPEFRLPEPGSDTDVSRKRRDGATNGLSVLRGKKSATAQGGGGAQDASRFLAKIGASETDAHAREVLNREAEATIRQKEEKDKKWFSSVSNLFSTKKKDVTLVEPGLERERISNIQKEGKTVTGEGSAATESGQDSGLLGKLLGQ